MPSLHTLPPELQGLVVDYLLRASDKWNVCLTCRSLHAIALPVLYYETIFDLNFCTPSKLNSWFVAGNAGHQHVRILIFRPDWEAPKDPEGALEIIKRAMRLLPKDSLREFTMPSMLAPDVDLLLLLASYQRKLTEIELGGPMHSRLSEVLNVPCGSPAWLTSLEALTLPCRVGGFDELHAYNRILRSAPRFQRLTINIDHDEYDADGNVQDMPGDAEHAAELVISTLFSHIAPFGDAPAMKLSHLRLYDCSVCSASHSLIQVVDCTQLTCLSIIRCPGSTRFLQDLTSLFDREECRLQSFDWTGTIPPKGVLEAFFKACCSLQGLRLLDPGDDGESPPSFDYTCLSKHFPTLTSLGLSFQTRAWADAEYDIASPLPQSVFDLISVQCPLLLELAVGLPETTLSAMGFEMSPAFSQAVSALAKCPSLIVLRALNWPKAPQSCFPFGDGPATSSLALALYRPLLDTFATDLLRKVKTDRNEAELRLLSVLAFGNNLTQQCVHSDDYLLPIETVCFVAASQTDVYGVSQVVAIRRTAEEISEVEEDIDILHDF